MEKSAIHKFLILGDSIDIVTSSGRRITTSLEIFSGFITAKEGVETWHRPLTWDDQGSINYYTNRAGDLCGIYQIGASDVMEYLAEYHKEEIKPGLWERITNILFGN